jgi:hypothetical protein
VGVCIVHGRAEHCDVLNDQAQPWVNVTALGRAGACTPSTVEPRDCLQQHRTCLDEEFHDCYTQNGKLRLSENQIEMNAGNMKGVTAVRETRERKGTHTHSVSTDRVY